MVFYVERSEKMTREIFIFKPCSTTAAFQATPKKSVKLNLEESEKKLKKAGFKTVISIKDFLMMQGKLRFDLFPNGKIIVKDCKEDAEAKKVVEKVYKTIGVL